MQSTILSSLTAEVLDAALSDYVFSERAPGDHEKMLDHFSRLLKNSNLLRTAIDEWGRTARDEDRIGDLFTLALYVGYTCRYSVEEARRLERTMGPQ